MENQKLEDLSKYKCKVCNEPLSEIIDFGKQPLGNGFLEKEDINQEYFYSMRIGFSEKSMMLQLLEQPEPKRMFHNNYAFFSSTSKNMAVHFESFAESVIKSLNMKENSPFVIELGCNDGILLKHFAKKNIKHLGIEPSTNVANEAKKIGINTISEFFSEELADKILETEGQCDRFLSANVMCHIPNINNVALGIKKLLKKKGLLIFEDPYLGDVVKKTSYDQIYDEHIFLFSALSIKFLFEKHNMELVDLIPQNTHGGSMRYIIGHKDQHIISKNVENIISTELKLGLNNIQNKQVLKSNVERSKTQLFSLLKKLKSEGKTIAGYAATSKSTTVFNYCNIGPELVDYICDSTPLKQGKLSPGMHIPIVSPNEFKKNPPDYALLLAWNHSEEIMQNEKEFTNNGGKWITHIPEVKIL